MNTNCKIHDFSQHHNRVYRCTFPDGREFVCEEPMAPDFDKLVSLMKKMIR